MREIVLFFKSQNPKPIFMSFLKSKPADFFETKSLNTSTVGATEDALNRSVKVRKRVRKIKEGTDGIDATDERDESDRMTEGFELLRGDD